MAKDAYTIAVNRIKKFICDKLSFMNDVFIAYFNITKNRNIWLQAHIRPSSITEM